MLDRLKRRKKRGGNRKDSSGEWRVVEHRAKHRSHGQASPNPTGRAPLQRLDRQELSVHGPRDKKGAGQGGDKTPIRFGKGSALAHMWPKPGPGVRFRVPQFSELKKTRDDPDLALDPALIKAKVERLLIRLVAEGRLNSQDPVGVILGKIFPGPGKMDEAEFNKVVDPADRSQVYGSVKDAETQVKGPDRGPLLKNIQEAHRLALRSKGWPKNLKQVFGSKAPEAAVRYDKTAKALDDMHRNLNAIVHTDYNMDDPEVGLGGWADHANKKVHLELGVVKGSNPKEDKITLIHEAAHLANPSVKDKGYYGSAGFEAMPEDKKINNAAHFEEVPRRMIGASSYFTAATRVFKPGVVSGAGGAAAQTEKDKLARALGERLRKAWDAGVDVANLLRWIRIKQVDGDHDRFNAYEAKVLEYSQKLGLTIHKQKGAQKRVTQLDITLAQGVPRAVSALNSQVKAVLKGLPDDPFPGVTGVRLIWAQYTKANEVIREAIKLQGVGRIRADLDASAETVNYLFWKYENVY